MLTACAEDTVVRFGGLGLKSLHECHVWVTEKFGAYLWGDCADGNHLKVLESRLKIQTGAEAPAISALAYARPRQFHKHTQLPLEEAESVATHTMYLRAYRISHDVGLRPGTIALQKRPCGELGHRCCSLVC